MAEEVVLATGAASPEPLDHKRKLADLDNESAEAPQENHDEPIDDPAAPLNADVAISDESDAKRPRLDGKPEDNGILVPSLYIVAFCVIYAYLCSLNLWKCWMYFYYELELYFLRNDLELNKTFLPSPS